MTQVDPWVDELLDMFGGLDDNLSWTEKRIIQDTVAGRSRDISRRLKKENAPSAERTNNSVRRWADSGLQDSYMRGALAVSGQPIKMTRAERKEFAEIQKDVEKKLLSSVKFQARDTERFIKETRRKEKVSKTWQKQHQIKGVEFSDGRRMNVDAYADMEAKTAAQRMLNLGTVHAARHAGIQFLEVSDGPECGWDGHDDPETANGKIINIGEDEEVILVSHPYCVRTFIPRPDLNKGIVERAGRRVGKLIKSTAVEGAKAAALPTLGKLLFVIEDEIVDEAAAAQQLLLFGTPQSVFFENIFRRLQRVFNAQNGLTDDAIPFHSPPPDDIIQGILFGPDGVAATEATPAFFNPDTIRIAAAIADRPESRTGIEAWKDNVLKWADGLTEKRLSFDMVPDWLRASVHATNANSNSEFMQKVRQFAEFVAHERVQRLHEEGARVINFIAKKKQWNEYIIMKTMDRFATEIRGTWTQWGPRVRVDMTDFLRGNVTFTRKGIRRSITLNPAQAVRGTLGVTQDGTLIGSLRYVPGRIFSAAIEVNDFGNLEAEARFNPFKGLRMRLLFESPRPKDWYREGLRPGSDFVDFRPGVWRAGEKKGDPRVFTSFRSLAGHSELWTEDLQTLSRIEMLERWGGDKSFRRYNDLLDDLRDDEKFAIFSEHVDEAIANNFTEDPDIKVWMSVVADTTEKDQRLYRGFIWQPGEDVILPRGATRADIIKQLDREFAEGTRIDEFVSDWYTRRGSALDFSEPDEGDIGILYRVSSARGIPTGKLGTVPEELSDQVLASGSYTVRKAKWDGKLKRYVVDLEYLDSAVDEVMAGRRYGVEDFTLKEFFGALRTMRPKEIVFDIPIVNKSILDISAELKIPVERVRAYVRDQLGTALVRGDKSGRFTGTFTFHPVIDLVNMITEEASKTTIAGTVSFSQFLPTWAAFLEPKAGLTWTKKLIDLAGKETQMTKLIANVRMSGLEFFERATKHELARFFEISSDMEETFFKWVRDVDARNRVFLIRNQHKEVKVFGKTVISRGKISPVPLRRPRDIAPLLEERMKIITQREDVKTPVQAFRFLIDALKSETTTTVTRTTLNEKTGISTIEKGITRTPGARPLANKVLRHMADIQPEDSKAMIEAKLHDLFFYLQSATMDNPTVHELLEEVTHIDISQAAYELAAQQRTGLHSLRQVTETLPQHALSSNSMKDRWDKVRNPIEVAKEKLKAREQISFTELKKIITDNFKLGRHGPEPQRLDWLEKLNHPNSISEVLPDQDIVGGYRAHVVTANIDGMKVVVEVPKNLSGADIEKVKEEVGKRINWLAQDHQLLQQELGKNAADRNTIYVISMRQAPTEVSGIIPKGSIIDGTNFSEPTIKGSLTILWDVKDNAPSGTMLHEFGHGIDHTLQYVMGPEAEEVWMEVMQEDAAFKFKNQQLFTVGNRGEERILNYHEALGRRLNLGPEPGVTEYASRSLAEGDYREDFAESFAAYMIDRVEGFIAVDNVTGEKIRFGDLFPDRKAALDAVFKMMKELDIEALPGNFLGDSITTSIADLGGATHSLRVKKPEIFETIKRAAKRPPFLPIPHKPDLPRPDLIKLWEKMKEAAATPIDKWEDRRNRRMKERIERVFTDIAKGDPAKPPGLRLVGPLPEETEWISALGEENTIEIFENQFVTHGYRPRKLITANIDGFKVAVEIDSRLNPKKAKDLEAAIADRIEPLLRDHESLRDVLGEEIADTNTVYVLARHDAPSDTWMPFSRVAGTNYSDPKLRGSVTVLWNTETVPYNSGFAFHETGHGVDHTLSHFLNNNATEALWNKAIERDALLREANFVPDEFVGMKANPRWGRDLNTKVESPFITRYAASSFPKIGYKEDFAESFAAYVLDEADGYIGINAAGEGVRFRELWPERAKLLDELIGEIRDPVNIAKLRKNLAVGDPVLDPAAILHAVDQQMGNNIVERVSAIEHPWAHDLLNMSRDDLIKTWGSEANFNEFMIMQDSLMNMGQQRVLKREIEQAIERRFTKSKEAQLWLSVLSDLPDDATPAQLFRGIQIHNDMVGLPDVASLEDVAKRVQATLFKEGSTIERWLDPWTISETDAQQWAVSGMGSRLSKSGDKMELGLNVVLKLEGPARGVEMTKLINPRFAEEFRAPLSEWDVGGKFKVVKTEYKPTTDPSDPFQTRLEVTLKYLPKETQKTIDEVEFWQPDAAPLHDIRVTREGIAEIFDPTAPGPEEPVIEIATEMPKPVLKLTQDQDWRDHIQTPGFVAVADGQILTPQATFVKRMRIVTANLDGFKVAVQIPKNLDIPTEAEAIRFVKARTLNVRQAHDALRWIFGKDVADNLTTYFIAEVESPANRLVPGQIVGTSYPAPRSKVTGQSLSVFWNGGVPRKGTIYHEFGHAVDRIISGQKAVDEFEHATRNETIIGRRWMDAVRADTRYLSNHPEIVQDNDGTFKDTHITWSPQFLKAVNIDGISSGITKYAEDMFPVSGYREDWAESFALFMTEMTEGKIGVDDLNGESIHMWAMFPNRWEQITELFRQAGVDIPGVI